MSVKWEEKEVQIRVPFYENLSDEDRAKMDAMLESMKNQRERGEKITFPTFKNDEG